MEAIRLEHDGRCHWLEKKILREAYKDAVRAIRTPFHQKQFVIIDWISADSGRVGVDLKWFQSLGIPAVRTCADLPEGNDFAVINTGYDSIVHEERALKARGVTIIDKPCPFVRNVRRQLERDDGRCQIIYLCEQTHITMKNFAAIFPRDAIFVQMGNFQSRISEQQNGKPFKVLPYVTFLPRHVDAILSFLRERFPDRETHAVKTFCVWANGKVGPVREIVGLPAEALAGVQDALLITTPGSTNRSLRSLTEVIEERGVRVVTVSSLREFLAYRRAHRDARVLLVRSPIPNQAERPILAYLRYGPIGAWAAAALESRALKAFAFRTWSRIAYCANLLRWCGAWACAGVRRGER